MDITPFKNLLNDMYAQDISRKVKSALLTKQRQGKYIGTKATYGYEKDPADKNHLIVNEKYAAIVRRIFRACSHKLKCSDCEADFSHNEAIFRRYTVYIPRKINEVMRKIRRKLEPVHIKTASKIMAKEIIARKIISSLS